MTRTPVVLLGGALAATAVAVPAAQSASGATGAPRGAVIAATQNQFADRITVSGNARDTRDLNKQIHVRVYAGKKYLGRVATAGHNHRFKKTFGLSRGVKTVTLKSYGLGRSDRTLASKHVRQFTPPKGTRIVEIAKRWVGKSHYSYGGDSPKQGFDCSGYTKYAYKQAKVASLPHNTNAQNNMRKMRSIPASKAKPGDLVFYHGNGGIYHVAIYAGHHTQYSATNPQQGIEHERIYSRNVSYGHLK